MKGKTRNFDLSSLASSWDFFLVFNAKSQFALLNTIAVWTLNSVPPPDDDWQEEHKRLAELDERDGLGGGLPLGGAAMGAESGLGGAGSSSSARHVPSSSTVHLPPQSTIPPLKFSSSSLGLPSSGTRCFFTSPRLPCSVFQMWPCIFHHSGPSLQMKLCSADKLGFSLFWKSIQIQIKFKENV